MRIMLSLFFVLIPVLAFAQARAPQVKRTNPAELSKPTGYTHIVEVTGAAKMVYISGQIAYDKDGKIVGAGDMKAQAEQVFKNLQIALAAAGATFSDVVKMNTYITDMEKAPAVRLVDASRRSISRLRLTSFCGALSRRTLRPIVVLSCGDDGDDFDLEHEFRPRKVDHLHQRARRRRLAEVARADFANRLRLVHVRDVGVHLHDVRKLRAGGAERRLQVLEHLLRLRLHVARADDVRVLVERDLTGDVHGGVGTGDFHDVRVAGGLRQCRRIGALHPSRPSLRERHRRHDRQERHQNKPDMFSFIKRF